MRIKRETKSGATIIYEKTIDQPATRALELYKKSIKSSRKKKKSKHKKVSSKKLLSKPKITMVKKLDPVRAAMMIGKNVQMVTEGEEGYFRKEYIKEKQNFLGGYSL